MNILIIVLGNKLDIEENETILFPRLQSAAVLYNYLNQKKGIHVNILVSGGIVSNIDITESRFMKEILVNRERINPLNIIEEDESTNTIENAVYSIPIIKNFDHYILITSDFHMKRALTIFNFFLSKHRRKIHEILPSRSYIKSKFKRNLLKFKEAEGLELFNKNFVYKYKQ